MDVDIAVLGGGPGGNAAAIRAAQLGARVACIDRAPELGGTCQRIGCIPAKAWAQTALALKQAEETFGKLGVKLGGSHLDFPAANQWKTAVVKRMTRGVAFLFRANGVTWVKGTGMFTDAHTLAVTGGEDLTFTSAVIATGSFPLRPPIEGLESDRCVDSERLLAQAEVPRRLVILGDNVTTGLFPWVANARAVMQNEHAGWVRSIHETRHGELLGLVMVGPHVTDLVEAGVVAIDAGATVETIADGMAPHPTLSEAIREPDSSPSAGRSTSPNRKPTRGISVRAAT
jgi:pyruvate/2-oxoglutarate dehydrogenase complex dihydrolipoamide dehydrogenase (E3) component